MPPLRHSISQIFAPHPALALKPPQSHDQAGFAASAVIANDDEMISSSSLQSQRPTVSIPSTSSTQPTNTPPTDRSITHQKGTFILDSATRHPVFFTDKLRRAPPGVMTCEYGNAIWRSGSPVARGYVYESGGVEEREAKL